MQQIKFTNDISLIKKIKDFSLKMVIFKKLEKLIKTRINLIRFQLDIFGLISDNSFEYRDINVIYESIKQNDKVKLSFYGNSLIKNKKS